MAPPIDVTRFEQLKASGDLPSPKGIALAIMRLTQKDDVSMTELARTIRTDPAFVGRLIKAANAVIGYGRRPIASVQDALTVLGMPTVRAMALGFSLLTNYRTGACASFDYSRYWSSSLLAAVTSQVVTMRTRVAVADETYCLGLLARVGELALATLYPDDYSRVIDECGDRGEVYLLELETRAFAMNHAELGAAMLADWGMPRVFTDAAYFVSTNNDLSQPEGSRGYVLTQTLAIARQMSEVCIATEKQRSDATRRLYMIGSRLSFDEEAMTLIGDNAVAEWVEWGALLNVHAKQAPAFAELQKERVVAEAEELAESQVVASDQVVAAANISSLTVASHVVNTPASKAMRALIVESNKATRALAHQTLVDEGFEAAEVNDGYSAAEFALDFEPDMMLIGSHLPDMSCEELITMLRQTRIGRNIYVIALSAETGEGALIRAFEAGADDMVGVPLNSRLLVAKISAAKRMTALRHENEKDREEIRHFAAELAVSNRRLQEVALVDALTGFPNRRFFNERLLQEWATSARSQRPISCLMLDLDNFKHINDTYGHDVGDIVLRQASAAIRQAVRVQDVVARTGGDEFIVLCPDTTIEAAVVCAERVRHSIESAQIQSGMLNLKISASIGVACRDHSIVDSESLLKRADQGMYLAKHGGRNRVSSMQLRPRANG